MHYIYQIRINSVFYVGKTINLKNRIGEHLNALRGGRHDNPRLQDEFDKSSTDIEWVLLDTARDSLSANVAERFWQNYQSRTGKQLCSRPLSYDFTQEPTLRRIARSFPALP